ncbi:unnamed protein product [Mytilus coruscus]|uniref:Uncharacterized protein n=1 Tax=Mytilus coruscus TaxID=42192 RepID=A0A6J8A5H9_MYTCO|nr:unnamed protein product [Mytilus coruscus]
MEFQTKELGENMIIKTEPDNDEEFAVNLECTEHVTVKPELSEDTENLTVKSEYANCVMENMLKPECCENVTVKTEYKEEVDDESSSFNCLCFGEQPNLEKNCTMFLKNNGKQELEGVVSILGTDLALNNPDKTDDTRTASLIKKTFAENIKMEPGGLILECEEEISMLTESCSSNDEDENRNECQLADSVLLDKFNSDMYLYKTEEMQERKHLETDCILKEPVYDISSHVTGCQVTRKHLTRYAARNKKEKNN